MYERMATTTILETSNPEHLLEYTGVLLAEYTSKLQSWKLLQTPDKDEMLFIEGQHQSTKSDEHIYHETFVHSLLGGISNPRRVLILGGAEGCMIREVLKWSSVQYIKQIDWDDSLVNYFRTNGWAWNGGAYENPRVQIECVEALAWLKQSNEMFDAIFIDLLDPRHEDMAFMKELLQAAKKRLNPNGGLSVNAGEVKKEHTTAATLAKYMETLFSQPSFSRVAIKARVPSYKGVWCFLLAGPKLWSSHAHSTIYPKGLNYFNKNVLIEESLWETFYPCELQNYWKLTPEEYAATKKLTPAAVDWVGTESYQYGC
jgi:spermidine synthase